MVPCESAGHQVSMFWTVGYEPVQGTMREEEFSIFERPNEVKELVALFEVASSF